MNQCLDRAAQAYLTPQARVRSIFVDVMRLERAREACVPAANVATTRAIRSLTKLSERHCTLLGLNAPIRVDPIQLAESTGPKLTSTQELRRIFDDFRSKDKKKMRNGGEGYGHNSWQDMQDREEMARERENADDDE